MLGEHPSALLDHIHNCQTAILRSLMVCRSALPRRRVSHAQHRRACPVRRHSRPVLRASMSGGVLISVLDIVAHSLYAHRHALRSCRPCTPTTSVSDLLMLMMNARPDQCDRNGTCCDG
jgi:hypothetical protein